MPLAWFAQGPVSGLSKIGCQDWRPAFARFAHLPDVKTFLGQVEAFGTLMATAAPEGEQARDLGYLLTIGQVFTQVVYVQLVAEAAALAIDNAPDGTRAGTTSACTGLGDAGAAGCRAHAGAPPLNRCGGQPGIARGTAGLHCAAMTGRPLAPLVSWPPGGRRTVDRGDASMTRLVMFLAIAGIAYWY